MAVKEMDVVHYFHFVPVVPEFTLRIGYVCSESHGESHLFLYLILLFIRLCESSFTSVVCCNCEMGLALRPFHSTQIVLPPLWK